MIRAVRQRLDFIGPFDWVIMGILIGLFVGAVFGSRTAHAASSGVDWYAWWDGLLQNSGTEMLGAFLTFVLLELVRGSREKREQEAVEEKREEELKDLQRSVADGLQKSLRAFIQAQEIARLRAAKTPDERQPILNSMDATDLLAGADLTGANLEGAILQGSNLTWTHLQRANLKNADLMDANLVWAKLDQSDLTRAILRWANLEAAHLWKAKLEDADLGRAKLIKTNLGEANLVGANLKNANLYKTSLRFANLTGANMDNVNLEGVSLEGAILPDGTKLPGRTLAERREKVPAPDWRTPFDAWDKAGRPRIEPAPEKDEELANPPEI